jgi:phosphoglucosamine mutase
MKLFGTDGIRGKANEYPITAEVALRLGKAVAHVLGAGDGKKRVLVGRDTRISGPMLEMALTSGLVSMGFDVILVGPLPTPAVALLTKSEGAAAGVMLTASHNPFEDNGMKIFGPDGYKLSDETEALIERHILVEEPEALPSATIGQVTTLENAGQQYLEFVKQAVAGLSLEGVKIVLDCGNGAASSIGPRIFTELGAEVITIATEPDGYNINENCGALHPEAAAELVRQHGADLGVSFDGDADRVIFTDATGKVVSGDRVLALGAIGLKEQRKLKKDTLVATVMSNLGLVEAMNREGIQVEQTAVGDRSVIECIRKNGYSFGGENSGHLIFADHSTTGDGILSALQILRLMRQRNATLAELSAVMEEYPTRLVNLPTKSKPPISSLKKLNALMAEATADFGSQGRQLIRYSGTENKIRVLVEHRDAAQVDRWVSKFTDVIREEIG